MVEIICPNCGLIVTGEDDGDAYTSMFLHKNDYWCSPKSDKAPEHDYTVDPIKIGKAVGPGNK